MRGSVGHEAEQLGVLDAGKIRVAAFARDEPPAAAARVGGGAAAAVPAPGLSGRPPARGAPDWKTAGHELVCAQTRAAFAGPEAVSGLARVGVSGCSTRPKEWEGNLTMARIVVVAGTDAGYKVADVL